MVNKGLLLHDGEVISSLTNGKPMRYNRGSDTTYRCFGFFCTQWCVSSGKVYVISQKAGIYFTEKKYFCSLFLNTWHICTYLNAFLMVIPNMVMKFLERSANYLTHLPNNANYQHIWP